MNRRTRIWTTGVLLATLGLAAACDDKDDPPTPPPTTPTESPTTAPSPAPTADATPQTAADLVGTWRDDAADWTAHFEPDGTFTWDFQGNVDFMTGTYTIADGVVTFSGLDGNDLVGRVSGAELVFDLGTLTKR